MSQSFAGSSYSRDLYDFARHVRGIAGVPVTVDEAAALLLDRIGQAVAVNRTQPAWTDANGLSIYLPGQNAWLDPNYVDSTAVWSAQSLWDEFLLEFTQGLYR